MSEMLCSTNSREIYLEGIINLIYLFGIRAFGGCFGQYGEYVIVNGF